MATCSVPLRAYLGTSEDGCHCSQQSHEAAVAFEEAQELPQVWWSSWRISWSAELQGEDIRQGDWKLQFCKSARSAFLFLLYLSLGSGTGCFWSYRVRRQAQLSL